MTLAVDRVSFDIRKGETVALVGESGSGKSVTALSVMKLLPYPSAHHPSGSIRFKGQELLGLPEDEIRHVRGNDITIIFQEPMTSLNPLHTIEKQIGEILLLHQGLTGAAARTRTIELLTQVGIPEPETRLGELSAPAVRRPAPARDDRDGARQRARSADRRRADDRARCHRAGADPQPAEGAPARLGMAMLFITHDLGIVRKLADTVCVMKEGKIVEQGPVERVFTAPEHPYTRALLAAEPKPDPAPINADAPVVVETKDLKVWFPIKRGVMRRVVGHIKAVDGVSIAVRKGETLGIVGESGSGKTTLGLAILRLISSDGPIVFLGKHDRRPEVPPDAAVPPRHADRVPGPLRLALAAHVGLRHHRGRAVGASSQADADRARAARGPRAARRRARSGRPAFAIRTNSPAASASASRSRARSCWSRHSSCSTSRRARSTC